VPAAEFAKLLASFDGSSLAATVPLKMSAVPK
jgi:hypothetical protein